MSQAERAAKQAKTAFQEERAKALSPESEALKRADSFIQCDCCREWFSAKQLEASFGARACMHPSRPDRGALGA
jgi:hypothetical protein